MPTASPVTFYSFKQDLASKKIDLTADTFMALLTLTAPNRADTVVDTTTTPCTVKSTSNAGEIAAGNGYTKKGLTCGTSSLSLSTTTLTWTLGTDPVWTASGGSLASFRYTVIYDDTGGTTSTRPVVCYYDYGGTVPTIQTGETFTLDLNQVSGAFTITDSA